MYLIPGGDATSVAVPAPFHPIFISSTLLVMSTSAKRVKSYPFLLSVMSALLLVAVGCTKTTSTVNNQNVSSVSVASAPTIFYEQKTITGFEAGGTPFGPSFIYRKDEVKGNPHRILALDSGRAFPSVLSNFSIENGELTQRERGSDSLTTTSYTFSGKQLRETQESIQAGFTPATLTNKDGSITVTAIMACSEVVENGPCGIMFHLKITNSKIGTEKTFEQKDFPNSEGGNFRAEPTAFTPDGKHLIVYVTQFGDFINPASFNVINLSDYSVTQLLKANYPNPKDPKNVDRLNYIRTSADGATIWAERDFGEQVTTGELLKIAVSPWSVQKVSDITPSIESKDLKPDDSGAILQSSDGGFSLLNFASGKKQTLADQGYFLGWSRDGQYYLYQVYDDNGNGLGPFRLMVGSMATGTQTEIVRQTVTSSNVKTTTKVGDILYAPVGIW